MITEDKRTMTKLEAKQYAREIIRDRSFMDYTTLEEDLIKLINKKFPDVTLTEVNEIIHEMLKEGEMFERFPREYLGL